LRGGKTSNETKVLSLALMKCSVTFILLDKRFIGFIAAARRFMGCALFMRFICRCAAFMGCALFICRCAALGGRKGSFLMGLHILHRTKGGDFSA
jgi:hypothetical protein